MGYKVYFLLKDMKPVYIGHTKRHMTRLLCHKDKDHNCVRVMSCKNKDMALYYEKRWQAKFKPLYNRNGIPRVKGTGEPKIKYKSKTVWVSFSLSIEEYERMTFYAKEQDRTPGNYISYAIIRAIRNDSFFIREPLEETTKLRIAK